MKHSDLNLTRIDLKSAAKKPLFVMHQGRKIPLVLNNGVWRLRSRSQHYKVDHSLDTGDLTSAKRLAREYLDQGIKEVKRSVETLEDLAKCYLDMPKRAGERTAVDNVQRLRSIVRVAWGKELGKVRLSDLSPALWRDYMSKKQGGTLDLSRRQPGNAAINAAVRAAASITIPSLRPAYLDKGIIVPKDINSIQWLPTVSAPPSDADDAALLAWWESLPPGSPEWLAIGLARFAGLRSAEISACRSDWLVTREGGDYIELRDRPEHQFWTKTGKRYSALILHPALADAIKVMPSDMPLVQPGTANRSEWFERALPKLMRPFSPAAKKPLHRLRGLYADHLARLTQDAVAARLAAVRAASAALGHTTTATTVNHYLDPDALL